MAIVPVISQPKILILMAFALRSIAKALKATSAHKADKAYKAYKAKEGDSHGG